MTDAQEALRILHHQGMALTANGVQWAGHVYASADVAGVMEKYLFETFFQRRVGASPKAMRASGDGGFVGHLVAAARGASGWETGFVVDDRAEDWAYATNGRVRVFLDDLSMLHPQIAQKGDSVWVCFPRSRENTHSYRFSLFGGQGPVEASGNFAKYVIPVTLEGAISLVDALSGKIGDSLRFTLAIRNDPRDFSRADTALLDVDSRSEGPLARALGEWRDAHPYCVRNMPLPMLTELTPHGLPRCDAKGPKDQADGFAQQRCRAVTNAVLESLRRGEGSLAEWTLRCKKELLAI